MSYLLDSNVFITAKDQYYGFDFRPAFWNWLVEQHDAGVVSSIEKVGDELMSGNDDLAEWAARRDPSFFSPPTPSDLPVLEAVAEWVEGHGYEPTSVRRFLQDADHYLIGQARTAGHTVVTLEVYRPLGRKSRYPTCVSALVSSASTRSKCCAWSTRGSFLEPHHERHHRSSH